MHSTTGDDEVCESSLSFFSWSAQPSPSMTRVLQRWCTWGIYWTSPIRTRHRENKKTWICHSCANGASWNVCEQVLIYYEFISGHLIKRHCSPLLLFPKGQFEGRFANPLQKNSGWPNEDMISEVREIGVTNSASEAVRFHGRHVVWCETVKPWGGERSLFLSFSFKHRSLVIKEYCVPVASYWFFGWSSGWCFIGNSYYSL